MDSDTHSIIQPIEESQLNYFKLIRNNHHVFDWIQQTEQEVQPRSKCHVSRPSNAITKGRETEVLPDHWVHQVVMSALSRLTPFPRHSHSRSHPCPHCPPWHFPHVTSHNQLALMAKHATQNSTLLLPTTDWKEGRLRWERSFISSTSIKTNQTGLILNQDTVLKLCYKGF